MINGLICIAYSGVAAGGAPAGLAVHMSEGEHGFVQNTTFLMAGQLMSHSP